MNTDDERAEWEQEKYDLHPDWHNPELDQPELVQEYIVLNRMGKPPLVLKGIWKLKEER